MKRLLNPLPLLGLILGLLASTVSAQSQTKTLILPAGAENTEGSDASNDLLGTSNTRIQQFYGLEAFPSLTPLIQIKSVAFRVNGDNDANVHQTFDRIKVVLSTTHGANQLSGLFSWNTGPDAVVVFDGPITFNAPPSSGPALFNIIIPFTKPFWYDSHAGNLLLDVSNIGDSPNNLGNLDAFYPTSWPVILGGTSSDVSFTRVTGTIATQFTYVAVPEPSVLGLGLVACFGCLAIKGVEKGRKHVAA